MKLDEYGEVLNDPFTFKAIAGLLKLHQSVLIGWTDENSSHFDILFTIHPMGMMGNMHAYQGGIKLSDLFVSIMRIGCFGFDINNTDTAWTYYDEKLTGHFGEISGKKLAELINGVKKEIRELETSNQN